MHERYSVASPDDSTPGPKTRKLLTADVHRLKKFALEAELLKRKVDLAKIEWELALAASHAANDATVAKMGVPEEAADITIDLNEGVIRYRMPGVAPDR